MSTTEEYARYKAAAKYNQYGEELFCTCRQPDHGQLMICCDGCENWFHFKCLRIRREWQSLVQRFFCNFCEDQGKGISKWKRKCRLEWCYNPVTDLKYCSRDHGLAYMREQLTMSGDTKKIVDNVDTSSHLRELGENLPQPPTVAAYYRGDDSQLPAELATTLNSIGEKKNLLRQQRDQLNKNISYYGTIRDAIKRHNESHPTKGKKADICGYSRLVKDILDEEENLRADDVCLNDRRRCLHNGWLSLLVDEGKLEMETIDEETAQLEAQMTQALQKYLVSIYEGEGMTPEPEKQAKEPSTDTAS